ncbi:MAG: hypothetical protein JW940_14420 [Polyangiaceae bacterium]|nr:hypothetical protein [Polyangiaceae bacterium]
MPEPLSPTVEALLEHERVVVEKPALVRARVLARARGSLQRDNVIALAPRRPPTRVRRAVYATAAGLAVAASVAAAYMAGRAAPTPPSNAETQPPPPLAPTPPRSPEPAPAPAPEAAPTPTPTTGDVTRATSASKASVASERANPAREDDRAVEELRLLESARRANARGDYASVLALVAEHARTYPRGRLTEEREVLRVRALVGLGRSSEARQAAARFRRQFPRSVLLATVEDMVSSGR